LDNRLLRSVIKYRILHTGRKCLKTPLILNSRAKVPANHWLDCPHKYMRLKIIKGINTFWLLYLLYYMGKFLPQGIGANFFYVAAFTFIFLVFVILLLRNNRIIWHLAFMPALIVLSFWGPWVVFNIGESMGYHMYHDSPGILTTLLIGSLTVFPSLVVFYFFWSERASIRSMNNGNKTI
jgi:hypothetical protein